MAAVPKQRSRAYTVHLRKRKERTFDRTYMGEDGLRHIVRRGSIWAACGQSILGVKVWGGSKIVTCLLCLGDADNRAWGIHEP